MTYIFDICIMFCALGNQQWYLGQYRKNNNERRSYPMKSFEEQDHASMESLQDATNEKITNYAKHSNANDSASMTQTAISVQSVFDAQKACMSVLAEVNAAFARG